VDLKELNVKLTALHGWCLGMEWTAV